MIQIKKLNCKIDYGFKRFATIDEKKVNEKLNKELHKQENK